MKRLIKITDDLLIWAGCILIVFGSWQAFPLAAPFVAGVILIILGILYGLEKRGANDRR